MPGRSWHSEPSCYTASTEPCIRLGSWLRGRPLQVREHGLGVCWFVCLCFSFCSFAHPWWPWHDAFIWLTFHEDLLTLNFHRGSVRPQAATRWCYIPESRRQGGRGWFSSQGAGFLQLMTAESSEVENWSRWGSEKRREERKLITLACVWCCPPERR